MSKQPDVVTINRKKLADLKAEREKAVKAGKDQFKLDGQDFDVRYAKYLIEYIEGELAKHPDQPARENREGEEGQ